MRRLADNREGDRRRSPCREARSPPAPLVPTQLPLLPDPVLTVRDALVSPSPGETTANDLGSGQRNDLQRPVELIGHPAWLDGELNRNASLTRGEPGRQLEVQLAFFCDTALQADRRHAFILTGYRERQQRRVRTRCPPPSSSIHPPAAILHNEEVSMFRMSIRADVCPRPEAARQAALLLLISLGGAPAVLAQSPAPAPAVSPAPSESSVPPDAALESNGAVIGDVVLRVGDVFDPSDPKENHLLFRLANKLHRNTRDEVIEQQLLFKPGDRYSRHLLDESERLLRQNRYLNDVKIRPVHYDDGRVDLEVVTRDVWTLNVGAGLGRSGGTNSTHLQLQDTNFLGTGKSITLEQQSDVDRTTSLFRYDDPALLGSRARLSVGYESNSDGGFRSLEIGRPFYSLETRWSAFLTASSGDQVDSLYELGHATERFHHSHDLFQVQGGLSQGLVDGWTNRWSGGLTFLRDRFEAAEGFAAPGVLPEDRTLAFPWIAWDSIEDKFDQARDVDQIERTEDFHLGSRLHARLGWSSPLFGGERIAARALDPFDLRPDPIRLRPDPDRVRPDLFRGLCGVSFRERFEGSHNCSIRPLTLSHSSKPG